MPSLEPTLIGWAKYELGDRILSSTAVRMFHVVQDERYGDKKVFKVVE